MSDLTDRLREESLRLMGRTFSDGCGSQVCAISASVADKAADRIEALEECLRECSDEIYNLSSPDYHVLAKISALLEEK